MRDAMATARSGVLTAVAAAAVLVAMLAFLPVVRGGAWWASSFVFVVVAVAVAAVCRRVGMNAAAAALIALASVLPVAALLVVGPIGILTEGPRQAAIQVLDTASTGFAQIRTDSVPARDTAGLALVMGAGAGITAVLVDLLAVGLGAPIAALLVVLAVAIVPGKTFGTGTNGWVLVAVAVAALAVIAADRRRRRVAPRLRGLAAGGAVALVVALAAQVVLPAPIQSQAQGIGAPLFGAGVDPLVRLGDNLRRGATTDVLTYSTDPSAKDVYLRLAVLEDFKGSVWSPVDADGGYVSQGAPAAEGEEQSGTTSAFDTSIIPASPTTIGERLPLPYPATSVNNVRGLGFRWDSKGLTAVRSGSDAVGSYTVRSDVVDTSADRLRGASTTAPPGDRESLQTPTRMPAIIERTEQAWTAGRTNAYDRALAIQNHLRGAGFIYDEDAPAQQGYDGDGVDVIAKFLEKKAGYCIHYASTMAVMARLAGIPSRIVVGYQPGTQQGKSNTYLVTSDQLHAWPELYFDGIGWVRFEPTPGQGAVPGYAPVPTASASPTASAAAKGADAATPTPTESTAAAAGRNGGGGFSVPEPVLRAGGIVLLLAGLAALPGLARRVVRRRRLRPGGAGARAAWRELLDSLADLGVPTAGDRSPRGVEEALVLHVGGSPGPRAALARLRAAVERQAYSPEPVPVGADDVRTVVGSAAAGTSRWRRFVAAVAPRSLLATLSRSRLAFRWSPPGSD